jgi:hypothetical protein
MDLYHTEGRKNVRDVHDGEAVRAQAVNSRVLKGRRMALEKCARNTGANLFGGGCQALEHTGAVRVNAHNFQRSSQALFMRSNAGSCYLLWRQLTSHRPTSQLMAGIVFRDWEWE